MNEYFEKLKTYMEQNSSGEGESVLEMLYEYHNEHHPYDNEQIKADFNRLYETMHGMTLKEVDRVIYTVCTLCRDHEKAGFIEGLKIGNGLANELGD